MQSVTTYKPEINKTFSEEDLLKGLHIVVLHANRIPPHIGIIADKTFHSLSIKGQDINVPVASLIRNINQRKFASLFIKIKSHSTFSDDYLREHFITNVQQFPRVDVGVANCLSPVKAFFEEVYDVSMEEVSYLYELLPRLQVNGLIENASSLFVDEANYKLPIYTATEINSGIEQVRTEFAQNSAVRNQ